MSLQAGVRDDKEKLRSDARRGKWSEVFETYKKEMELRTTPITGTGDTVLHMLASNGKEKVVANVVDFLVDEKKDLEENRRNVDVVLGAENKRKNTPLHFAASM